MEQLVHNVSVDAGIGHAVAGELSIDIIAGPVRDVVQVGPGMSMDGGYSNSPLGVLVDRMVASGGDELVGVDVSSEGHGERWVGEGSCVRGRGFVCVAG